MFDLINKFIDAIHLDYVAINGKAVQIIKAIPKLICATALHSFDWLCTMPKGYKSVQYHDIERWKAIQNYEKS